MTTRPACTLALGDAPAETQLALTTILAASGRKPEDVQTIVHAPLDHTTFVLFTDFKWLQIKSDARSAARARDMLNN